MISLTDKINLQNSELPDIPYSMLDIQDYFELHEKPVQIYVNKIDSRFTFKVTSRAYDTQTMKLLKTIEDNNLKKRSLIM